MSTISKSTVLNTIIFMSRMVMVRVRVRMRINISRVSHNIFASTDIEYILRKITKNDKI